MTMTTVKCHNCLTDLDADAETTFWDDSGDYATCTPCAQAQFAEAQQQGTEALRMLASLARAYQRQEAWQVAEFMRRVQAALSVNPEMLDLAAELMESSAPTERQQ